MMRYFRILLGNNNSDDEDEQNNSSSDRKIATASNTTTTANDTAEDENNSNIDTNNSHHIEQPQLTPLNTVSSSPPEATRRFNYSRYATKKTMAQGLLDVALLMSNASQLKAIMDVGTSHNYYHVVFGIVIVSIVLQIITAILLLILGSMKDETDAQKKNMNVINNVIIVFILLITVSNVFITAFGVQFESPKKMV